MCSSVILLVKHFFLVRAGLLRCWLCPRRHTEHHVPTKLCDVDFGVRHYMYRWGFACDYTFD